MKHIFLTLLMLLVSIYGFGQTNTFPSSGNVGIGTTSPAGKLNVQSDELQLQLSSDTNPNKRLRLGYSFSDNYGSIQALTYGATYDNLALNPSGGNVGIGTIFPYSKLHVSGLFESSEYGFTKAAVSIYSIDAAAIGRGGVIALGGKTGNATPDYPFAYISGGKETISLNNYAGFFAINTVSAGGNGEANSGNYERFRITSSGNVGIGTTNPTSKLSVNGNIRAKEVKVETANWPDYVFAKEYELPSLQATEQHIKDKGHLPGIPSAAEIKANGLDLGEMNAKLLQKIEELTLYLIEIKKDAAVQKEQSNQQIDLLKKDVEKLKTKNK